MSAYFARARPYTVCTSCPHCSRMHAIANSGFCMPYPPERIFFHCTLTANCPAGSTSVAGASSCGEILLPTMSHDQLSSLLLYHLRTHLRMRLIKSGISLSSCTDLCLAGQTSDPGDNACVPCTLASNCDKCDKATPGTCTACAAGSGSDGLVPPSCGERMKHWMPAFWGCACCAAISLHIPLCRGGGAGSGGSILIL